MGVTHKKLSWMAFTLILVSSLSSSLARRLATPKTDNFGILPSGPSTFPPDHPPHPKIDNFGMLPSGPSTWTPGNPPHTVSLSAKTNNVGMLPSEPSTFLPKTENFGMLPSEPSKGPASYERPPAPPIVQFKTPTRVH